MLNVSSRFIFLTPIEASLSPHKNIQHHLDLINFSKLNHSYTVRFNVSLRNVHTVLLSTAMFFFFLSTSYTKKLQRAIYFYPWPSCVCFPDRKWTIAHLQLLVNITDVFHWLAIYRESCTDQCCLFKSPVKCHDSAKQATFRLYLRGVSKVF